MMHTDLDIHERQIAALEKRLARVEKVAQAGMDLRDDYEAEYSARDQAKADVEAIPTVAAGEGPEATDAAEDLSVTQGADANYTTNNTDNSRKETVVMIANPNDGVSAEVTNKLKKKLAKHDVILAQHAVDGTELRDAFDEFKNSVDEAIRQLQRAHHDAPAQSVVDNSTTVVRYDGKALWKEDLEQHIGGLEERIKELEATAEITHVDTNHTMPGPAPLPPIAPEGTQLPPQHMDDGDAEARPSPKKFGGTQGNSMQHYRTGIHSRSHAVDDISRQLGESELLRRIQALERAVGTLQRPTPSNSFSPEKRAGGKGSSKLDNAKLNSIQSQIRDMQTSMQLVKRQLTNQDRKQGFTRKASVSGNSMFVGTR